MHANLKVLRSRQSSPMGTNQERKTIEAMIRLFCKAHHQPHELCLQCSELLQYADARLAACPFGDRKPTCRKCPVHCYRRDMKEKIAEVMRFAGPRMIFNHPILAVRHLLRGRIPNKTKQGDVR